MTELFIENQRADMSADISALLTFALDDIQDFGARNTAFSKTIVLPGTARNNQLFGHIFDTRSANLYDSTSRNIAYNYNPAKRAACLMFVDQIQTFKGYLRLLEVRIDKGAIEYEVAVFGELHGLVNAIGKKLLTDLDFSAYDHTYSVANITASWNDYNAGEGYYYPLIDHGNSYGLTPDYPTQKHDWQYLTFRPALFAKEYIDKIFAQAAFTYDCPLFATERFKRLIIPHNKKVLSGYSNTGLIAGPTLKRYLSSGFEFGLEYANISQLGSFTSSLGDTRFTYNGASTLNGTLNFTLTGNWKSPVEGRISLRKNGTEFREILVGIGSSFNFFNLSASEAVSLTSGDYIEIKFEVGTSGSPAYDLTTLSGTLSISTIASQLQPINLGESVPMNDQIPVGVLQRDFFASIIKLFNLYVYDDPNKPNHVRIAPYVDFYNTDLTQAVDWSHKVDRSKPIQIVPMSELNNRFYDFKFKPDNDYYNELYNKRYNDNYGDRLFDSDFDFADDTSSVEVIFSPTILVGYDGEDKVYSTIYKMASDIEEAMDSNIRILQALKVTGVSSWKILNGQDVLGTYTDYPYAGHFNDPDDPTNDIHFGSPKELFFELVTGNPTANQFNLYWSSYMAEITDKDSKLLRCKLKLDTSDILNLDFSRLVWIDGALWRINKIEDYNMSRAGLCTAEFLKVIEIIY